MITSPEEFVSLRLSEDRSDQARAGTEEASIATWKEVIRRYPEMRRWVAYNKTVPPEILRLLATDPDPAVRLEVASKRRIDEALLHLLSRDPDDTVRGRIARHHRADIALLQVLAQDASWVVRRAAEESLESRAG